MEKKNKFLKLVGRKSDYGEAITDVICERIANGESLRAICDEAGMPAQSTVFKWLGEHFEFSERYARARVAQADVLFDEILKIADTPVIGVKTVTKAGGVETVEGDMIEHRRLQIDARKWIAAKMSPKKYGDKTQIEHSGSIGAKEIEEMTDAELIAIVESGRGKRDSKAP